MVGWGGDSWVHRWVNDNAAESLFTARERSIALEWEAAGEALVIGYEQAAWVLLYALGLCDVYDPLLPTVPQSLESAPDLRDEAAIDIIRGAQLRDSSDLAVQLDRVRCMHEIAERAHARKGTMRTAGAWLHHLRWQRLTWEWLFDCHSWTEQSFIEGLPRLPRMRGDVLGFALEPRLVRRPITEVHLRRACGSLGDIDPEPVLQYAKPQWYLASRWVDDKAYPPGADKVGGLPDLPPDTPWPKHERLPMSFVAQVDLAALARWDGDDSLPSSGVLSFFFAAQQSDPARIGDPKTCAVLHLEAPLERRPKPRDLRREYRFDAFGFVLTRGIGIPCPRSAVGKELCARFPSYRRMYLRLYGRMDYMGENWLMGHPRTTPGWEAAVSRHCDCPNGACAPVLLWRSGTEFEIKRRNDEQYDLNFWIFECDLQARRFERCWTTYDPIAD